MQVVCFHGNCMFFTLTVMGVGIPFIQWCESCGALRKWGEDDWGPWHYPERAEEVFCV